jgi:hypothetical protein
MSNQDHGHRAMWSISIVERSPDIEVPDTVDDDLREPHCTMGTSEHERRAPQ